jgi:hypothetical protein
VSFPTRQAVSSLIDHTQFVTESGQILLFGISDFSRDDDRANRGFCFSIPAASNA